MCSGTCLKKSGIYSVAMFQKYPRKLSVSGGFLYSANFSWHYLWGLFNRNIKITPGEACEKAAERYSVGGQEFFFKVFCNPIRRTPGKKCRVWGCTYLRGQCEKSERPQVFQASVLPVFLSEFSFLTLSEYICSVKVLSYIYWQKGFFLGLLCQKNIFSGEHCFLLLPVS